MGDVIGDDALGVVKGERHQDADALALDGFVEAFDLAVRLRIIGRSSHMGHAHDADELFEVLGDELRPLSLMMRGRASGNFSRARRMMDCTSLSSIFWRMSLWTMKRL